MRPAGEKADPCGVRPVPAVSGAGGDAPPDPRGPRRPRRRGDGALPPGGAGDRTRGSHPGAEVPPWGDFLLVSHHPDRVVPPESAEHPDGSPQGGNVRQGLPIRAAHSGAGQRFRAPSFGWLTLFKVDTKASALQKAFTPLAAP